MANINKHRTRKGMLFMATFTIRGKNVEITPALRDYVEKRIGKVTRYFKEVGEISALLSVSKDRQKVEVTVPENYMGDIIGDISSRRGRIEGSDINNGAAAVRGFVPLSEMFGYATDLRSKTQGRGVYVMQFDHFDKLPESLVEKVTK